MNEIQAPTKEVKAQESNTGILKKRRKHSEVSQENLSHSKAVENYVDIGSLDEARKKLKFTSNTEVSSTTESKM